MKKSLLISIAVTLLLVLTVGCGSNKDGNKNASLSSDFSSIMQELSKKYDVKPVNNYSTDSIPNIDGYEFKVDGKPFKVLKMQESDFDEYNFEDTDNDFLTNIKLAKNNSKPYVAFIGKDDNSEVLDDFKNIDIE